MNRETALENRLIYNEILYGTDGRKLALISGLTQSVNAAFLPLPGGATAVYNASGLNRYRHPDWLGSSRIASTTARTVSYDAAYSPFGESYAESGSTDRNFTGQNQDLAGDMYDFMYRQYHAPQGRWVSPDPAGTSAVNPANPQSWNRYAYVNGSPLNSVDPLGLCGDGSDDTDGGTCAPTYYPQNDGMGTWGENDDEGNWLPDAWKGYGPGASTPEAGINVGTVWGSGQIGTSMIYSELDASDRGASPVWPVTWMPWVGPLPPNGIWIQQTPMLHQLLVISVNGKLSAFEFAAIGFGLPFGFTGQVQQEKDPTRGTVLAQYPPLKLTQQQAQTALDVVKPQVGTTSPYLTPVPFMGWADCRAYAQAGYALFQKVFGR